MYKGLSMDEKVRLMTEKIMSDLKPGDVDRFA